MSYLYIDGKSNEINFLIHTIKKKEKKFSYSTQKYDICIQINNGKLAQIKMCLFDIFGKISSAYFVY